jgi:hypothetical protein
MSNYGLQQAFDESISAVTATPSNKIGTERWENGRKYIYMYNKSTSTCNVEYGVVFSASSGWSVTASSIGGESIAGVVRNAQLEPTTYGWVMVKGHTDLKLGANDTAVLTYADKIKMDADGVFKIQTAGVASTDCVIPGCPVELTGTAGTFAAFINVG